MESRGDRAAANGLLIIVDSTGIPVLVRPYGDVQRPPSAAIGIVSAVFHAAKRGDGRELRTLRSQHRSIVYVQQANDFLLAFAQTQAQDKALFGENSAQRILQLVFHALRMLIGPTITEMESSKLRGAIARQLTVVDYICTNAAVDPSLAMGVPTFAIGSRRGGLDSNIHPKTLLYAARLHHGIVDSELCSPAIQLWGLDLLIMCVYSQANESRMKSHTIIYVNGSEKKTALKAIAVFDHSGQDKCMLRIFTADTNELDLKTATPQWIADPRFDSSVGIPVAHELGLVCFYVCAGDLGRDSTLPLRGIFHFNPPASHASGDDSLNLSAAWLTLGNFVVSCSASASTVRRIDYIQQEEGSTFVHCNRAPLSVYAIFIDAFPIERVGAIGDMLVSTAYMQ